VFSLSAAQVECAQTLAAQSIKAKTADLTVMVSSRRVLSLEPNYNMEWRESKEFSAAR
jgi:hypothetical protein